MQCQCDRTVAEMKKRGDDVLDASDQHAITVSDPYREHKISLGPRMFGRVVRASAFHPESHGFVSQMEHVAPKKESSHAA
jgi:hypothetical protein